MQVLKIDFSRPWVPQPVRAMQGDAGTRFVAFDLYDGGADYEIPGGASFTVGYQLRGGFEGAYKNFGFREVALRKFYYGDEDGILMEKQVM